MRIEIDVPKGATKIDIGPVLVPILRKLMRCGIQGKDHVLIENVEDWVEEAYLSHENDERLILLRSCWIASYCDKHGWSGGRDKDGTLKYEMKRVPPKPMPERWHSYPYHERYHQIRVSPDDYPHKRERLNGLLRSVNAIAAYEKRTIAKVISAIEAEGSALEQLARCAE